MLAALTLLVASTAFALQAGTKSGSKVIHACANRSTGAMRYVPSGHCKASERSLSWNRAGRNGVSAPSANLSVALHASPNPPASGGPIVMTVTVTNSGPSPTWAGMNGLVSSGSPTSVTTNHGYCTQVLDPSKQFTCAIGILPAHGTASIVYHGLLCQTSSVNLAAAVTGSSYDPVASNNAAHITLATTGDLGCG